MNWFCVYYLDTIIVSITFHFPQIVIFLINCLIVAEEIGNVSKILEGRFLLSLVVLE
jgi:hypothetical protein